MHSRRCSCLQSACHYIVKIAHIQGHRAAARGRRAGAFTLVELLVSVAVFALMLIILARATSAVSGIWTRSTGQIEQFRNARSAFETITERLSQATLNPYWDYTYNGTTAVPTGYMRQSDLRFISGPVQAASGPGVVQSQALCNVANSEAMFFQAPLGVVSGASGLGSLRGLMNTCGYYLNFGSDSNYWPAFLQSAAANDGIVQRYRYRLMEMVEPSDQLTVYGVTSGAYGASQVSFTSASIPSESTSQNWFTVPLSSAGDSRILANNIVALVILPHLANPATSGTLSKTYQYDSTSYDPSWSSPAGASTNSYNQLPPIVQVTMVAIDENSAIRLAQANGASAPNLGLSTLFKNVSSYSQDIATLQQILQGKNASYGLPGTELKYRIFSSDIPIAGAQWSTNY